MLTPSYAKQFERDIPLMRKRGEDLEKLKPVIRRLIAGEPLDAPHRDHKLIGNWQGRRECHIEPDWLDPTNLNQSGLFLSGQEAIRICFRNDFRRKAV